MWEDGDSFPGQATHKEVLNKLVSRYPRQDGISQHAHVWDTQLICTCSSTEVCIEWVKVHVCILSVLITSAKERPCLAGTFALGFSDHNYKIVVVHDIM